MKTFMIVLLCFLTAVSAFAKDIARPAYLDGATVTVTLANGKSYSFKSEDYAVVPRHQADEAELPAQPLAEAPAKATAGLAAAAPRNALRVYLGGGPAGIKTETSGSTATVDQAYGLNYGLGYGRMLNKELSLDGLALFNRNGIQGGLLGLGYNW